jgi:hypothetical protein
MVLYRDYDDDSMTRGLGCQTGRRCSCNPAYPGRTLACAGSLAGSPYDVEMRLRRPRRVSRLPINPGGEGSATRHQFSAGKIPQTQGQNVKLERAGGTTRPKSSLR